MLFARMKIEQESPEEFGYGNIKYNLTESSTPDKTLRDLGIQIPADALLCYGDHRGNAELRQLVADRYAVGADDVIVTNGSVLGLFIIYSTLLRPGDRMLVVAPNYPANIEIARSLECQVDLFQLRFEERFLLDADRFISMLRPDTKLASITLPHNPTGATISAEALSKILAACQQNGTYLLVDETYGDLVRGQRIPHVCNMSKYGLCVESLSKAIGAPGLRTGWIVTRDEQLQQRFIAAKEQIVICGSTLDEECSRQIMERQPQILAKIKADVAEKFAIVREIMEQQDLLEWVEPECGVVCFPRIKAEVDLDINEFYRVLNEKYGVFVGPGHWFDMDDRYFRIGYAWPTDEELRQGLLLLLQAIKDVRR